MDMNIYKTGVTESFSYTFIPWHIHTIRKVHKNTKYMDTKLWINDVNFETSISNITTRKTMKMKTKIQSVNGLVSALRPLQHLTYILSDRNSYKSNYTVIGKIKFQDQYINSLTSFFPTLCTLLIPSSYNIHSLFKVQWSLFSSFSVRSVSGISSG